MSVEEVHSGRDEGPEESAEEARERVRLLLPTIRRVMPDIIAKEIIAAGEIDQGWAVQQRWKKAIRRLPKTRKEV